MSGQVPPINPYEPSRSAGVPAADEPAASDTEFQFNSRLDWSDRRALLRSIGPTRVAVVCNAILWLKALFDYGQAWTTSLASGEPIIADAINLIAIPLLGLLWAFQGLLIIYLCWLDWKYAERLQAAAGGRKRSWNEWSVLHYRTARLAAIACVLALLIEAGDWMITRWDAAAALQ